MHIVSLKTEASVLAFTELAGHFAMYFYCEKDLMLVPFLKN